MKPALSTTFTAAFCTLLLPLATPAWAQASASSSPAIAEQRAAATKRIHDAATLRRLAAFQDGKDNVLLKELEAELRQASAPEREKFEAALLEVLQQGEASVSAKREISDLLSWAGGEDSVDLLTRWAAAPESSDAAVRALRLIPGKRSESALLQVLTTVDDTRRPAVLDALALRRSTAAVSAIKPLLASSAATVSGAAIEALGYIASRDAVAALQALKVDGAALERRTWALVRAGEQQVDDGRARDAEKIFRALLAAPPTPELHIAAAQGLLLAGGPAGLAATESLLSHDKDEVAARFAPLWLAAATDPQRKGSNKALTSLQKTFSQLPARVQSVLLEKATQLGRPSAFPLARQGLASTDAAVRQSALFAVGETARELKQLEPLFDALKQDQTREAAISALSRARVEGLENRVRDLAASAEPSLRSALFAIAAARVDHAIMPQVLEGAKSDDRNLRQASFRAMGSLVRGENLATLLEIRSGLRTGAERRAWHEALLNAARFRSDTAAATKLIAEHLPEATSAERGTFAIALSLLDGNESTEFLRQLLADPSVERRKEIIRGLSSARNLKAAGLLIETAEKGADETERILALRGHLDILVELTLPGHEKVAAYRRAWKAALRDEERLAIISGVDRLYGDDVKRLSQELHQALPSAPPAPARLQS